MNAFLFFSSPCAFQEDDELGWPDFKRGWEDTRWSTPPAMAATLPFSPDVIPPEEREAIPDPSTLVIPVVAVFITSVVLHPTPKSFSKPGSGLSRAWETTVDL